MDCNEGLEEVGEKIHDELQVEMLGPLNEAVHTWSL